MTKPSYWMFSIEVPAKYQGQVGCGYAIAFYEFSNSPQWNSTEFRAFRIEVENLAERINSRLFKPSVEAQQAIEELLQGVRRINRKYPLLQIGGNDDVPAFQIDNLDGQRLEIELEAKKPHSLPQKLRAQTCPIYHDGAISNPPSRGLGSIRRQQFNFSGFNRQPLRQLSMAQRHNLPPAPARPRQRPGKLTP